MGKNDKVTAPVYEEWSGNEYTDRARKGIGTYGDWVDNNWERLITAPTAQDFTDIVNKSYDTIWNDYNRSAIENIKKQNQANYNRFGNMGSSGAMYGNDTLNRNLNDLASRIYSNMYGMADELAGNQFNRNLTSLGTVYGMYNDAGKIATELDQQNWDIRNQNIAAKYAADVQNANRGSGWNWGNMLSGAASGAATGAASGGGWVGALVGGVGGGLAGGLSGNASGNQAAQLGSSIGGIYKSIRGNSGGGTTVNLNTQGGNILGNQSSGYNPYSLNTQYNPSQWKFSWQRQ